MNEQEWLESTDPQVMLDFMFEETSRRKIQLYTTNSYRIVSHLLTDERFEKLHDVRDRYFDGLGSEAELTAALVAAEEITDKAKIQYAAWKAIPPLRQLQLARDLFGNPFRPVTLDPLWLSWNNGAVSKMAQAIYDDRAFERVPVLGEALEKAGCTNVGILSHCRQPGEHWRGCWVVDLLLDKQ